MGNLNEDLDCELIVIGLLDKEMDDSYDIQMKLRTLTAFANPTRMFTNVSRSHIIPISVAVYEPIFKISFFA